MRNLPARSALLMRAAELPPEPDEPEEEKRPTMDTSAWDWSTLSRRITSLQEVDVLEERLVALEHAWVLVYDADTDDEAVYSMEMEGDDSHVVLAFESRQDAEDYAQSLSDEQALFEPVPSVQALDVEALVVTSRDADFRVGVVFEGDLAMSDAADAPAQPLPIWPPPASKPATPSALSITMVPEGVFEGKSAEDYLDPSEDPVWVLVHDAGTGDAQYFSMNLNGTASVVCFKDEAAAQRCGVALSAKGAAAASAQSLLLEELLDTLGEGEVEVCLVDEVVETVIDSHEAGEDGAPHDFPSVIAADAADEILGSVGTFGDSGVGDSDSGVQQGGGRTVADGSSLAPAAVREMLTRLYEDSGSEGVGGAGDAADR